MSKSSSVSQTIIIPVRLGRAADFDQSTFPFSRLKGTAGLLREGDLLLAATMDEMTKIFHMSKEFNGHQRVLKELRVQYDDLMEQKKQLESQRKSMNPIKLLATFRETRLLVVAGRELYFSSRTTSEALRRALLSIDSDSIAPAAGENHEEIAGIAINLDGLADDTVSSFLSETASLLSSVYDPFADFYPSEYVGNRDDPSFPPVLDSGPSNSAPGPSSPAPSPSNSTPSPTNPTSSPHNRTPSPSNRTPSPTNPTPDPSNSTSSPTSPTPSINYIQCTFNSPIHTKDSVVKGLTVNNGGYQPTGAVLHDIPS